MKTVRIDVGQSQTNEFHGQDACDFRVRAKTGEVCCVVADGLSEYVRSGELARELVNKIGREFLRGVQFEWGSFRRQLVKAVFPSVVINNLDGATAASTLSVLIIDRVYEDGYLVRYFAIGDSPIVHAHDGPLSAKLPGTRICRRIHGRPIQASSAATVYGWIDDFEGLCGRAHEGEFYVRAGDIILLCSDGVRLENTILQDFGDAELEHRFFSEVEAQGCGPAVQNAMDTMIARNMLVDDASLIAVHLLAPPKRRPFGKSRSIGDRRRRARNLHFP